MDYLLEILFDFYQQNSVQIRPIGKIRDVLERRTNQHIRLQQITKCGIQLASKGFIRVEGHQGKQAISGWENAIILQNGLNYVRKKKKPKVF